MASGNPLRIKMVTATSAAAGTSRSGNRRELSEILTGPRPPSLQKGAGHLIKGRHNDDEEGVQPGLDVFQAQFALPFSQGAESYDAVLYPSSILVHPFDTLITDDLNLTNIPILSNAAIKTTAHGFGSHSYERCSSNRVLNGGYQVEPHFSCGAPSTSDGRGMIRRPHQKRGRDNIGGEKEPEEEDDGGVGEARSPSKRRHLGPGDVPQYFGCVYYKRDPWGHWRCYCKYGFKRVADVKGHLKRVHTMSEYYCPTCFAEFPNNESWRRHTQDNTCQPTQPPEHILTVEKFEEINQAFSDARRSSDSDKWYLLYDRVFPSAIYRPASPYVYPTFDEPLQIIRERAFRQEVSNGPILTVLQQHGVPLQGIDLVSLRTRLINVVLPTLAEAMATNTPSQTRIPPPLAPSWGEFAEHQDLSQQDLQSQQPLEVPEEDQQDGHRAPEQLSEQQWLY